jgi:hypothetical protein
VRVTLSFIYLLTFLGGSTLALVTGLVRRLLHPSALADHVTAPSHEHWLIHHTPISDLIISFATVFGLTTFVVHGVASMSPGREIAIGAGAGLIGVVILKILLGRIDDPIHIFEEKHEDPVVVREIPANGYGQIEVTVEGAPLKMAARSNAGRPIPAGTVVEILDRQESVVVVEPAAG